MACACASGPLALLLGLAGLARGLRVDSGRPDLSQGAARGGPPPGGDALEQAPAKATGSANGPQWLEMPWQEGAGQAENVTRRSPNGQRVAVLTSGSLRRYFLTQAAEGLVAPLVQEGYAVDYYAALSVAEFSSWVADADKYVPEVNPKRSKLSEEVKATVAQKIMAAGGLARTVPVIENVDLGARDNQFINESAWNWADGWTGSKNESDKLERVVVARRNVMSMLKPLQLLGQRMEAVEAKDGKYDYVVIVKDDAIWMKPFSLQTLLTQPVGSSNPDGYVLRCDSNDSTYPTEETEVTEYILVLKRSASTPFYMMHELLMHGSLAGPKNNEMLQKYWDVHNLETFVKMVADDYNVRLQRTSPYLLPVQRGGRLKVGGKAKLCLHKCCDSSTKPYLYPMKQLPTCDSLLPSRHARASEEEGEDFRRRRKS